MDSGACKERRELPRDISDATDGKPAQLSESSEKTAALEPITPVPNRELVDFPLDRDSPITAARITSKVSCLDSKTTMKEDQALACVDVGYDSPQTPKDVVFDPFAPGPDNMAMAPLSKKWVDHMRITVARRLNFESFAESVVDLTSVTDVESISDEEMVESVYKTLLEAIVTKHTEDLLAEMSNVEWDSECCKTPPVARLNGVAETCPAAPMKSSYKSRKIDLGLIRKLEF